MSAFFIATLLEALKPRSEIPETFPFNLLGENATVTDVIRWWVFRYRIK